MVNKFTVPLLTPYEAATHLQIPERTMRRWLRPEDGRPALVHSVGPPKRGRPSVPFIALVEAYVLRALRDLELSPRAIAEAAAEVRAEFGTEYGLATRRIATDGIDVFIHYLDSDELARAQDRQIPIRGVVEDYLKYVSWDSDGFAQRLVLRRYDPAVARVVIDPRFAWGAPIVEQAKVTVDAVLGMWRGGESPETVAGEYGLSIEQVEALIRVAA
ncbi:DUF433 domain-containing protein [Actinoplanes sp. TBRC 11911]|uniref:DUF433 domain-containing protein n=1 Tax=Actinoplanes sp. TBRC 11911 TaxID=2729386 RepID=UPI00145C3D7A|nr:DUF433 domain-containing protein [Actinoplanes sp. TBRC 11911]NMO50418.1 DUF433 domain-containing protein [Actinoplanes sp. TBRC 11911]